jgi:hypothetical protein
MHSAAHPVVEAPAERPESLFYRPSKWTSVALSGMIEEVKSAGMTAGPRRGCNRRQPELTPFFSVAPIWAIGFRDPTPIAGLSLQSA